MKPIIEAIKKAQYNYTSDCTGYFTTKIHNNLCQIIWSKDESGKYSIDEFSICKKGKWTESKPTEDQKEIMFKMLDEVEDRKEEQFIEPDDYWNCGVRPEDFY